MRVMLRNRLTGFWLRGDGNWTESAAYATDFGSSTTAAEKAAAMKDQESEVVFSFGKPERDVVVSVGAVLANRSGQMEYRSRAE